MMQARYGPIIPAGLLATLAALTLAIDVLLLVQPIYMLQVYDRVVPSASLETLIFLSIAAAGALIVLGMLDGLRAMLCGRASAKLEARLGGEALVSSMEGRRATLGDIQNLRDLGTVRSFLAGRGVLAFLDLPFVPIFVILLYLIHPALFFLTIAGAVILALLAWANQRASHGPSEIAGEHSVSAMLAAQAFVRGSESARAMGMTPNAVAAWGTEALLALNAQDRLNRVNAIFSSLSRTLRLGLQVAILGLGGYLVVVGEMTAGMIFASSLISGRALQPIDQIIAGWKGFGEARRAWSRLSAALQASDHRTRRTELPAPAGRISLEEIVIVPPAGADPLAEPLLNGVTASIEPGECLVVMGPSGAGKSTLMRAIAGVVPLRSGAIRIDGADIRHWDRDRLGRHIGYLAQDVDLLPGTIAQNIARFDVDPRGDDVLEAARKAQVHDLIQRLPKGYDTVIGPGGIALSGGQRQRIGLARAFYGSPVILVLDEPNANLDAAGEEALERALAVAREQRVTVVLVTQRHKISRCAEKVLMLRRGMVEDFGAREEVVARQLERIGAAREEAARPPHGNGNLPGISTTINGRFSPVTRAQRAAPPAATVAAAEGTTRAEQQEWRRG
jgi:ATP-binding cassette subfamily C protein